MKGKIIKIVSGTYSVKDIETNTIHTVKPKGIFRYHSLEPKVGDDVDFNETTILKMYDRKNTFVRPKVSNVDYVILIMSSKSPNFDLDLLDRFLLNIERNYVKPIIVITKCDLLESKELETIKSFMSYYKNYYNVFYSDINGLMSKDELFNLLKGKVSILSGQTGAGKSHLLNTIFPELSLETQEISKALGRGKHTTRETTLYDIDGMYIADSPGFSSLDFSEIEGERLKDYYPEFRAHLNECKYNECLHLSEPNCKIKDLVNSGEILATRYESYKKIYTEIKQAKKVYGRKY